MAAGVTRATQYYALCWIIRNCAVGDKLLINTDGVLIVLPRQIGSPRSLTLVDCRGRGGWRPGVANCTPATLLHAIYTESFRDIAAPDENTQLWQSDSDRQ